MHARRMMRAWYVAGSIGRTELVSEYRIAIFRFFCQLSERGGFHSLSGFLRYLAYCAVRAAGGDMTDEIPEGVLRVFKRTYDYDVRTLAEAVKLVEEGRVAVPEEKPTVEDEIGGMFRELSDEGAERMFPGDVNWRK